MASIARDKNGSRRILFVAPDGRRPTIRLGKKSLEFAREVKGKVEKLLEAKLLKRAMPAELAEWVADLEPWLAKKLARVRLISDPEARPISTLEVFLDGYIAKQDDKKPSTIICLKQCRNDLVAYFGPEKPLNSITEGDAEDWRHWMRQQRASHPGRQRSPSTRASKASYRDRNKPKQEPKRLQENTIRRRCGRARQLFQAALRHRLIDTNPFAELKGVSVLANKNRDFFVTRAMADAVLNACPDSQWRLLFVLSRYGGLRCPSEHLGLRWSDIDWERGRIVIRSPKTEHHEGKEHRIIPLFPELRPYLEAARDEANPGIDVPFSDPIITRYRDVNANLRTQFMRIIANAGLAPWPKLFQNLRASRATELAGSYPGHVAAAWLGHSTDVARRHYWQVTDEHFDAAISGQEPLTEATPDSAAQKAAQPRYATYRGDSQAVDSKHEKSRVLHHRANPRCTVQTNTVAEAGLEPARP